MIPGEYAGSSHAEAAERWRLDCHSALGSLAMTHGDPTVALLAGESAARINNPRSPLYLTATEITANPRILQRVAEETPATAANKWVKELLAQAVIDACKDVPPEKTVDVAAGYTRDLLRSIHEQKARDHLFNRLSHAQKRANFIGGYLLPTPANVPNRGIIQKVDAMTRGMFNPAIIDIGGSAGLVYRHQLHHLPYDPVDVGMIERDSHGFVADPQLTDDFNYLANHPGYRPRRVAVIDLVLAIRGFDLIRTMVYSQYPQEWLDEAYSQKQVDLIKLPIPGELSFFEDNAADLDLHGFKTLNSDLSEGADVTTAMTMLHQAPAESDRILKTASLLTRHEQPLVVQDFGTFVHDRRRRDLSSQHGTKFNAEKDNWRPYSYTYWVALNEQPHTRRRRNQFERLATCTSPRVKQIEPSEEFAAAIRDTAISLRRQDTENAAAS